MKILVACEESGVVTEVFRNLNHEAWSCDILPTSGNYPEYHLQQDVVPLLKEKWDMIIAFPPCTRLASTAQRWLHHGTDTYRNQKKKERDEAIDFFMLFVNANCPKIAIENPIGIMSNIYRKPDQIVHPYMFGESHHKNICLWLKGLPLLQPTNIVEVTDYKEYKLKNGGVARFSDWYNVKDKNGKYLNWGSDESKRMRSRTWDGVARAMGVYWG